MWSVVEGAVGLADPAESLDDWLGQQPHDQAKHDCRGAEGHEICLLGGTIVGIVKARKRARKRGADGQR